MRSVRIPCIHGREIRTYTIASICPFSDIAKITGNAYPPVGCPFYAKRRQGDGKLSRLKLIITVFGIDGLEFFDIFQEDIHQFRIESMSLLLLDQFDNFSDFPFVFIDPPMGQ